MAGHSDDDGDGEYTDGYGYACDDDVEVGEGSPNEKRQRKSAAGRKLIRWSCKWLLLYIASCNLLTWTRRQARSTS